MIKDRRKQWQKDSINFSVSRCGTVTTERKDFNPTRLKRARAMITSEDCPTLFTWFSDKADERCYVMAWDTLNVQEQRGQQHEKAHEI